MKRVTIIGCPGAGKSTFARALAAKTNLPLHHLDFYYHQKEHDYEKNKQAWLNKMCEITSHESWIIEGNYGSSYEYRIPKSDTLIFMDIPSWLSTWSVLKRRCNIEIRNAMKCPTIGKKKLTRRSLDMLSCFVLNLEKMS